jgi:(S)-mandelate dehydrogenase
MKRRPYAGRDPARATGLADLRAMAHRRLPGFVAEYLEGGAEDEVTLRENRAALDRHRLVLRALCDVSDVRTDCTLLGQPAALPMAIAPTGYAGILWPGGDVALARAAAAAGIPFCQSIVSNAPLAEVRRTGCRHWMQVYPFGEAVFDTILQAAQDAGTEAIVFTVDGPVIGNREWDRRSYRRPFVLTARSLAEMLLHPRWVASGPMRGLPGFPNIQAFAPPGTTGAAATARWAVQALDRSVVWADCDRLRARWPGKFIVKGLACADDARRAVDAGADAVVVSNHGGRQLDGAPASIDMLPAIVAAVGGRAEVYMDSGVRRGADIARAVACGAAGVLTGRATLYGLAAAGEPGVARAIAILKDELLRVMALTGVRRVADLGPHVLYREPGAQA